MLPCFYGAYKNPKPLFRTQYSEILVKYKKGYNMKTGKLFLNITDSNRNREDEKSYIPVTISKNGNIGGKFRPQNKDSTRLQELSLMNTTYFGAINYDIHIDIKINYSISRIFQEMSLSELETQHHLCELERTQKLQSLPLAVIKIHCTGYLLSGNCSNFIDSEGNIIWYCTCTKNFHHFVFADKRCYQRITFLY